MKGIKALFFIIIGVFIFFFIMHLIIYNNSSNKIANFYSEDYDYLIPDTKYNFNPKIELETGKKIDKNIIITSNNSNVRVDGYTIIVDSKIETPSKVNLDFCYKNVKKTIEYNIIDSPIEITNNELIYGQSYYINGNYDIKINDIDYKDYINVINTKEKTIVIPISIGEYDLVFDNKEIKHFSFKFFDDNLTKVVGFKSYSELKQLDEIIIDDGIDNINFSELEKIKRIDELKIISNNYVNITGSFIFNTIYVLDDLYSEYEKEEFFYKIYPKSGIVIIYPDNTIDIIENMDNYIPKKIIGYEFIDFSIKNEINKLNDKPKKFIANYLHIKYNLYIDKGFNSGYNVELYYGDTYDLSLLDLKKENYYFLNWYDITNDKKIEDLNFIFNFEYDVKIKAIWGFDYYINYAIDDTILNKNLFENELVSITSNYEISKIIPLKVGYTFSHWLINGDIYENQDIKDYAKSAYDIVTITPVFDPNKYKITYYDSANNEYEIDAYYDSNIKMPEVVKEDYVLDSWYLEKYNKYLDNEFKYNYDENIILKPRFEYYFDIEYSYENNSVTKTYYSKDDNYFYSINPINDYVLAWEIDNQTYEFNSKISNSIFNKPGSYNCILKKTPIYYLNYYIEGKSNSITKISYECDKEYNLYPPSDYTNSKASHYLINGTRYELGQSIKNLSYTAGEIINVYIIYKYIVDVIRSYGEDYTLKINGVVRNSGSYAYPNDLINISFSAPSGRENARISMVDGLDQNSSTFNMPYNAVTIIITSDQIPTCIIEGTKIMLSDGTYKNVEDLTTNDKLMSFNHETGKLEEAVGFIDPENHNQVLTDVYYLLFDNGNKLGISFEHRFFDTDLKKYIIINSNTIDDYIGDNFLFIDYSNNEYKYGNVKFIGYEIKQEYIRCYSPVTFININFISNNILTASGGIIDGLFNYFELDDNYKFDIAKKEEDIEKYGLYTYDDFLDFVPYEFYEYFNGAYLKISVEKGIWTFDDIILAINKYLHGVM